MVDFVDQVNVHLKAGNGGNGCASIRREKFKPLAGPNGGNGGNGGSIILKATKQSSSLLDYHFSKKHTATSGSLGLGGDKDGTKGENLILPVPLGTVVKWNNPNTGKPEIIHDFLEENEEFEVCKGGIGGLGNARLANSQRKAPGFALLGTNGEEAKLIFELKLLADVALVGFPSSGKSSIIAAISAARPKIGDYPFTTLTPNLGVVTSHSQIFTVADVPGLIPGAAEGKGLGLEFLRHIERTKIIVHIIDMNTYEPGRDPISDLEAINKELKAYDEKYSEPNNQIMNRPQLILLNKVDDKSALELAELTKDDLIQRGYDEKDIFLVSAATHVGLDLFKGRLADIFANTNDSENHILQDSDNTNSENYQFSGGSIHSKTTNLQNSVSNLQDSDNTNSENYQFSGGSIHSKTTNLQNSVSNLQDSAINPERKEIKLTPLKAASSRHNRDGVLHRNEFSITHKGGENPKNQYWEIQSDKLRNWVLQTDFANDEAVGYLADRLNKIGIEDELAKLGANEHDEVRIITRNTRAPYIISEQEYYAFNYEPALSAGAEMLYSNVRGEDTRLDMFERAQRMTRQEKRDLFHQRQDARAATREQFAKEKESGFWADASVDASVDASD